MTIILLKKFIIKANVIEEKSNKKKPDIKKFSNTKKSMDFKLTNANSKSNKCYHCHKINHYVCDCKILKVEKKKGKTNNNRKDDLVSMITKAL